MFCYLVYNQCRDPTTPIMPKHNRFGLLPVRSPLLGESLLFSLPTGTKMFQFPAFASISNMDTSFEVGFPIRTSAGHRIFAPNRSFSQLITSFFASVSQGIRHAPFSRFSRFACLHKLGDGARSVLLYFAFFFYSSVQYVNDLLCVPTTRP